MSIKILLCSFFIITKALLGFTQNAEPETFLISRSALKVSKQKIQNKDAAYIQAYTVLLKQADKLLNESIFSVMDKKQVPPSGDKHDYMSLAPYWWPNLKTANGLPYIRKDGERNPELKDFKDKENIVNMVKVTETLALAYYFSEDEKYAAQAVKNLRIWFLNVETKMNPNLNYAQVVKGHNDGRGAGVIETHGLPAVVDAIGLISASKLWTSADQKGMEKWFADFLNWLQTSPNGKEEMAANNNHGTWFDVQRLSFALFLKNSELADAIANNALKRLDVQMDDQGSFPAELERTKSLGYSTFNLSAFFQIATLAEKTKVDIWRAKTPTGKSLTRGIDFLLPYYNSDKKWTGKQIEPFNFASGADIFSKASMAYNSKVYCEVVNKLKIKDGDKKLMLLTQNF